MKNPTTYLIKRGALLAGVVLTAGALQAQEPNDGATPRTEGRTARGQGQANQEALSATSFIKEAMQANLAEIALAETAIQKGQSADVKQFAEHIKTDHTAANQKLQTIAQKKGVAVDQELGAKHKKVQTDLSEKSGEEFDKEFATLMMKDHYKAISKYQEASRIDDSDVKEYTQETLPKLRQHMAHGKEVAKTVGVEQSVISKYQVDEAVGGTVDRVESDTGAAKKELQKQDEQLKQELDKNQLKDEKP